jgi:hypothetical protein
MTARHLSTKNRPDNSPLKRRFTAEEWAMPEDGPPMEGALPSGAGI